MRNICSLPKLLLLPSFALAVTFAAVSVTNVNAQAQSQKEAETVFPCKFDNKTLLFEGNYIEQAECLLRPLSIYGKQSADKANLPLSLKKIIGKRVKLDKAKLRLYLSRNNIEETKIGGSLDSPLSFAKINDKKSIQALYFIIHDVSTPNLLENDFPPDINEQTWKFNDLEKYWSKSVSAHMFINRLGQSVTNVDFASPLPQNKFGTKFARDFLGESSKGLQIHIELIQPRKSDPFGQKGNDAIAPFPGFALKQYERLALVYIAASVRRGIFLIPAFHANVDAGIKDAHDDPQNFSLEKWVETLMLLLREIEQGGFKSPVN